MAPRPKNQPSPEKVQAAVQKLKDVGAPDLAEAVAQLAAAVSGWTARTPEGDNFPIWLEKTVKAAAQARAKQEGRPMAAVVQEAWAKFRSGEFVPRPPTRGGDKTSLVVRLPAAEIAAAETYAAEQAEALGWPVTERLVAASYLRDVYAPAE